ncbi:hypothetical protein [Desulfovibrio subterraneus]|jgi:hypothetical protein|uniref:Uncharacterized protein n=1 Tax=Desulfovibrio subterraneus TaxID=2718620 RepID=A0A7J0BFY1_9BACT|nr:hypothetical protein [Desulfovibrio subterraneus]GFM32438.1 hypothetical protein DSM101010T_08030 [Desulfovibrio subterraneus]
MILNASQLNAIRQLNDEELRKGQFAAYGYPAHTIRDMLHTIEALKKEKKKWQRLAQDRGQTLQAVRDIIGSGSNGSTDSGPDPEGFNKAD